MQEKRTTSTRSVTKSYRKPFDLKGNMGGVKVKKMDPDLGDGDIYTEKNATKYYTVDANLYCEYSYQRVRMHICYQVWEDTFRKKKAADGLYMETDVYFPIADFLNEGNQDEKDSVGRVVRACRTQTARLKGEYGRAYTFWGSDGEQKNYISLAEVSPNLPSWFPARDLYVKIDGSGSELDKEGNIGVKGYVEFTIERVDQITNITYVNDTPTGSTTTQQPTMGSEPKIETFPRCIQGVLGYGYDIRGNYADASSCKQLPVVDYKKLNEYRRICRRYINDSFTDLVSEEGIKEYTSKIEENLGIKVSGQYSGFSFANETKSSFKSETFDKTGYKYATQKDLYVNEEFTAQGCNNPSMMTGFLSSDFLNGLNNLTPDELINNFGTHVVLGMKVGTRFMFNMSYRQSITKKSASTMFSSSNSVSYSKDGKAQEKPTEGSNSGGGANTSVAESLICQARDWSDEKTKTIVDYLKGNSGKPSSASGGGGGGGGGAFNLALSTDYSKTSENTLNQEDQSTNITCRAKGGSAQITQLIARNDDVSQYEKWVNSCNESNYAFVDFVPGTLVPIYELVPPGYKLTAAQVKSAVDRYLQGGGYTPANYLKGVETFWFDTLGKANTENINSDSEISTQKGKSIYWRLRVELMNFDDGHCGYGISLMVHEGGRNANKTILLNRVTNFIVLKDYCASMAIDTGHPSLEGMSVFEADGDWVGTYHNWTDATKEIENSSARRVIDCDSHRVEVHLDDSGYDLANVGIRGWIKIPWIGYKKERD